MKHLAAALTILACASVANAQTSYPMLMSLQPVAAQTGQTSEHTLQARYSMFGAYKVIVSGEGVRGEIATDMKLKDGQKLPNMQSIKLRFVVDKTAKPGVRDFRVATPNGVSTLGQLVITRDAIAAEGKGKNDQPEQAQQITLPATVCGCIERAEDVDYYKFDAKAGQALTLHVRCMRLQDRIHDLQQHADPIITLRNESGTTLAAADNHFAADPILSHRFTHDGTYYLEIRDVRYQGNRYWEYCVEMNGRPFVSNVFPMGLPAGQASKVELVGFQLPKANTVSVQLPKVDALDVQELTLPMGKDRTNPVPVVASDQPVTVETPDPNNVADDAQKVAAWPTGISGRIEKPADVDCFLFTAKKGEKYTFEVLARRYQSGLDSNLRILNAEGKRLTENDDMRLYKRNFADSLIENWTAPADGDYVIEIRDLHLRGGAEFVYFIKATRAEPHFELYLDTDKTQLTENTAGVLFANVVPKNGFQGEVELQVDGLPAGVTAQCGRVLSGQRDGCIVLTAKKGVKLDAANVTVTGHATVTVDGKERKLVARAQPYQETYQPGGGRGHWPVPTHTVGIASPSDLRAVKLSTYDVSLKPGETKKIEVTIDRAEGFTKNVQLDLLFRHLSGVFANPLPPGVTIDTKNSKTLLTAGATKGHITLMADATKAKPVAKQQVAVMANVSLNFVMKATYSSQPFMVTVTE